MAMVRRRKKSPGVKIPKGRFIVKIQIPLATNAPEPLALVYNQERTLQQEFPISDEVWALMGDSKKEFMYARFLPDPDHPGKFMLSLEGTAPWQEW